MIRLATVLIPSLLLSACGRKQEAAGAGTEQYREWKGSQAIRQLAAAGLSEKVAGTVVVHFPEARSQSPEDFIELCLNGQMIQHTRFKRVGGEVAPITLSIDLRPGIDWLDLWDSTTNRYYRFQVDPRQGTDFVFAPTETGYDLTWTKRE